MSYESYIGYMVECAMLELHVAIPSPYIHVTNVTNVTFWGYNETQR